MKMFLFTVSNFAPIRQTVFRTPEMCNKDFVHFANIKPSMLSLTFSMIQFMAFARVNETGWIN